MFSRAFIRYPHQQTPGYARRNEKSLQSRRAPQTDVNGSVDWARSVVDAVKTGARRGQPTAITTCPTCHCTTRWRLSCWPRQFV